MDEYCTPKYIIEFARYAMGSIDVDMASSEDGNKIVEAPEYYTKESTGLDKYPYYGNVWLNPPYSYPLVERFVDAGIATRLTVKAIMILVNSSTDTRWYHSLLEHMTAVIFFKGRLSFILNRIEQKQNRVGQSLFLYTYKREVSARFFKQSYGYAIKLHPEGFIK